MMYGSPKAKPPKRVKCDRCKKQKFYKFIKYTTKTSEPCEYHLCYQCFMQWADIFRKKFCNSTRKSLEVRLAFRKFVTGDGFVFRWLIWANHVLNVGICILPNGKFWSALLTRIQRMEPLHFYVLSLSARNVAKSGLGESPSYFDDVFCTNFISDRAASLVSWLRCVNIVQNVKHVKTARASHRKRKFWLTFCLYQFCL